jgi:hypothetical protein
MRKYRTIYLLALALACAAGWWFRRPLAALWPMAKGEVELAFQARPRPDPKTYAVLTKDLERWRKELSARHAKARTDEERAAIEREARAVLETALPVMMHCWLGTPYDFNGTASGPGKGKVACGYFVATVLKDAGFRVDRYQLAQQASGNILRSFLPEKSCALTVGESYETFAAQMAKRDPGIYVVGLDTHVAFIVVGIQGFRFIHATGARPHCVVDQTRDEARTLRRSNWRMLGNLTAERSVIRHWLKADEIVVRRDS